MEQGGSEGRTNGGEGASGPPPSSDRKIFLQPGESIGRCPICLKVINDRAVVDPCHHDFCFGCITKWSQRDNKCPFCRQIYVRILHNITSETEFQQIQVEAPEAPDSRRFRGDGEDNPRIRELDAGSEPAPSNPASVPVIQTKAVPLVLKMKNPRGKGRGGGPRFPLSGPPTVKGPRPLSKFGSSGGPRFPAPQMRKAKEEGPEALDSRPFRGDGEDNPRVRELDAGSEPAPSNPASVPVIQTKAEGPRFPAHHEQSQGKRQFSRNNEPNI